MILGNTALILIACLAAWFFYEILTDKKGEQQ